MNDLLKNIIGYANNEALKIKSFSNAVNNFIFKINNLKEMNHIRYKAEKVKRDIDVLYQCLYQLIIDTDSLFKDLQYLSTQKKSKWRNKR